MSLAGANQGPECLIKEQGVLENIGESVGMGETNIPGRGNPAEAQKRGLKGQSPHRGTLGWGQREKPLQRDCFLEDSWRMVHGGGQHPTRAAEMGDVLKKPRRGLDLRKEGLRLPAPQNGAGWH